MINKLLKYEVHSLNKVDKRYRFEVDETIKAMVVRLYIYDDQSKIYFLRGNVMIINKAKDEFRSDSAYRLIKNQSLKAELIRIACDYCNISISKGVEIDDSEYVQ